MSRVRIYELAKEAGMASKVLADKLIGLGYDIKGHSSTVDDETAAKIRSAVLKTTTSELVEKRIETKDEGAPTVIRRRATTIIRRPKKEEPVEEVAELPEESAAEEPVAEETSSQEEATTPAADPTPEEKVVETEPEAKPATEDTGKKSALTVEELIAKKAADDLAAAEKQKEDDAKSAAAAKKAEAEKPAKRGIAKVIGTIELPKEEPKRPPRKKSSRPPVRRPGSKPPVNQPPADPSAQARGKKKGKAGGREESEEEKAKGFKKKKGRKNVRVTRFGYDGAHGMRVKANEIIAKLMDLGVMATVNQALDLDTAMLVAADFSYEVEQAVTEEISVQKLTAEEEGGKAEPRSPVITVMGHVDHGKTSILDAIRKTDVADGEAGGITQHIGAYHVQSAAGDVTFVDTPGHAAFTEMRSRGAQITDLVILVVAADDGVMNQTREAIHHAQAAEVPIIVAVNKIDKDNADSDRVKRELAELDLSPEEWGGKTIFCEMSAKNGTGIDNLLENIELMAEMLELKADPKRKAIGHVVEAKLDKGRGPVATILVQEGTLRAGDHFVVGQFAGKVRALLDYRGKPIKSAGPSIPVEVQGITGVPSSGDEFVVVKNEKQAKNVAQERTLKVRESELAAGSKVSLDSLFEKLAEGDVQELRIVLRADVQGTLEAFAKAAEKLSTDEVKVKILHEGTGTMTDSDVLLASASEAIIIGFNVRPSGKVKELAMKENVDMRSYDVIYHALDDITAAMVGMLAPNLEEDVIGNAEVRETFQAPKVGTVAGCAVTDGKILRSSSVRVVRDGVVVYTGKIESLRRFKDDAKEVLSGYECGISVEKFNDIKIGDNLEAFVMKEVAAKLGATQQEKDDKEKKEE